MTPRQARAAEKAERREQAKILKLRPKCIECAGQEAQPVGGDVVYPHRPDLKGKRFWLCPCGAYVGTHDGTWKPLGYPAKAATHAARRAAHAAFDPLWRAKMAKEGCTQKVARGAGYWWLSEQLGIPVQDCHIAMFDAATARRVVEVVANARKKEPA